MCSCMLGVHQAVMCAGQRHNQRQQPTAHHGMSCGAAANLAGMTLVAGGATGS
jgi:hypothetical protein